MILRNAEINWNVVPKGMTILFFGHPKTWKTTVASSWAEGGRDSVLLIDTELGSDFVPGINRIICTSLRPPVEHVYTEDGKIETDGMGIPKTKITEPKDRGYVYTVGDLIGQPMPTYSLQETIDYIFDQIYDNNFPFETVVIDTIDEINTWVEQEVIAELKIPAMGAGEYGSDWALARDRVTSMISELKKLLKQRGINLILISHAKNTSFIEKGKTKIIQQGADLPRGIAKKIMGMCELIGYVVKDGKDQVHLSFDGFDEVQMGSRLRPLQGKKIKFSYQDFVKEVTSYKQEKKGEKHE
jgi:hypothetical protein